MEFEAERGYIIVASNNNKVDYIACARTLAKSIHYHMPGSKVCLLTDAAIDDDSFDYIKLFPYGDQSSNDKWKLDNDWQIFWATPFRETIKIEADMIVTGDISHWWSMCEHRDVVVTSNCRDYLNNISTERHYRKIFDLNNLPDLYNAITYWRYSKTAQQFFTHVRNIFNQWEVYKEGLRGANREAATTDVVYAMAAVLMGVENVTLPKTTYPSLIHMKSKINGLEERAWDKQLVWELVENDYRINTVSQRYPVHYHDKKLALELEPIYDKLLGCA